MEFSRIVDFGGKKVTSVFSLTSGFCMSRMFITTINIYELYISIAYIDRFHLYRSKTHQSMLNPQRPTRSAQLFKQDALCVEILYST
jgi:hypothetical protein